MNQSTANVPQPPTTSASGGVASSSATSKPAANTLSKQKIDLTKIKTPSGKTIKDFQIPRRLLEEDPELVDYIMRSESMKDEERQYWFNLTEIMTTQQIEKLRSILKKEREKLAEIEAKYGRSKPIDPEEAARRAQELARKRALQQQKLREAEARARAQEAAEEEAILKELENL